MMRRGLPLLLTCLLAAGPAAAESFSFAAMCDSRGRDNGVNTPVLSLLARHLTEKNPRAKFLVFPGDMVDGSPKKPDRTRRQLIHWKKVMAPLYTNPNMLWPKVWVLPGNHEMQHPRDRETFRELFPDVYMNGPEGEKGLTYSFDHGNTHFVMAATDRYDIGDPEDPADDKKDWYRIWSLEWLRKDLRAAKERGARHIFVFGHDPAFPISGAHLGDGLPNVGSLPGGKADLSHLPHRDAFWDILVEFGVTAYVCGHEHLYGRQSIRGVYQIVTGGAGAPLYLPNPCRGREENRMGLKKWLFFKRAEPYYRALGYPHGEGDNCQASPDFKGGAFFHYVLFDVKRDSVAVKTWGLNPKEGERSELPDKPRLRLMDAFTIKD